MASSSNCAACRRYSRPFGSFESSAKNPGPQIHVVRGQIRRRRLGDRLLLVKREFGLQLSRDRLRDLALDGEHIRQVAIVSLRPEVRVGPSIDQLRVHPHFAARPLHTAFEDVGHAQLLTNFAQIARGRLAILHHTRPADHFEVGHPREIGQNLILHAIGEEGVVLVGTQIFEGKNGDRFLRDRGPGARLRRRDRIRGGNQSRYFPRRTPLCHHQYPPPTIAANRTAIRPTAIPACRERRGEKFGASAVRTTPCGVASNAQANTTTIGKPIRMNNTTNCAAQSGKWKTGKTCVATSIRTHPTTA